MPAKSLAQLRFAYANKRKSWARNLIKHTSRQALKGLPDRVTKQHSARKLVGHRTPYKRRRSSGRRRR